MGTFKLKKQNNNNNKFRKGIYGFCVGCGWEGRGLVFPYLLNPLLPNLMEFSEAKPLSFIFIFIYFYFYFIYLFIDANNSFDFSLYMEGKDQSAIK